MELPALGGRFLIQNNVFEDVSAARWGGTGTFFQTILTVPDLVINHNTVIHEGNTFSGGDGGSNSGFQFTNNIVQHGPMGFKGSGTGDGNGTLNAYFPGFVFTRNVLAGSTASLYPASNFFPSSYASVGFVDFANGDYRLAAASAYKNIASDGTDPGANIDAVNAATICALSGQCSGASPPDATPPAISAVVASSVTASQAVIGWATNENADTQVEYGPTTAYGSATTVNPAMVTAHSQGLSNLSPFTVYHYRVRSKDANGNLATSGNFTLTTLAAAPPADTTPPVISAVTNAAVSSTGATVSWVTNEASDSQLQYGLTTAYGSTTVLNSALITSHAQAVSGLLPSTVYHYRVRSRDAAGNLAMSGDFTFKTLGTTGDTVAPSSPTGVTGKNVRSTRITVAWNASTDNVGVTGYRLDVAADSAFTDSFYTNVNVSNVTSFTVNDLDRGTRYYFRVRAYDAAGNVSASSAIGSARTRN